jgi:integral membrane sensor domain MASE1
MWPLWGTVAWTWWLGDMLGILVVTPLILVWRSWPQPKYGRTAWLVSISYLLSAGLVSGAVFFGELGLARAYYAYPILVWAALAGAQRGVTAAVATVAALAVWGTTDQITLSGPEAVTRNILALQEFLGITTTSFLVMGAIVSERTQSQVALIQANKALQADIIRRKQAEERFTKAFTASPVALSITRLDNGCFVDVNDSFLRRNP